MAIAFRSAPRQFKAIDDPVRVLNSDGVDLLQYARGPLVQFRKKHSYLSLQEILDAWRMGLIIVRENKKYPRRMPKLVLQLGLSRKDVKKVISGLRRII